MKKIIILFAFVVISILKINAQVVLSESFIYPFIPSATNGWVIKNNSVPIGTSGWTNGNGTIFAANSGGANDYFSVDYSCGGYMSGISNFLITPTVNLVNGAVFQFATRTRNNPSQYPDRLDLRMSIGTGTGAIGSGTLSVGTFTNLLVSINPSLFYTGYPNTWTVYSTTLSGITGTISGRFAFRYYITNGGPNGVNSDYIGIDDVQYSLPTTNTNTSSVTKILFDASKAETASNADWIIDADANNLNWNPNGYINGSGAEANAQRFPTPSQNLITASTPETYWSGALSAWGIDCVKKGYQVETLPYNGQITYGNSSNVQDLSNYQVFVIDEPNILFTSAEKIALINFVQNGGGLFLISDHMTSDRNGDGDDSPNILNDFISNNGVLNNGLGFTFDLANISQTSYNIPNYPTDSILHGPMGHVTQVQWAGGTTMSLNPSQNPSVKGVVYKSGSPFGNSNAFCAYAHVGKGKVAALGDSSPAEDGTGDSNDVLYDGYISDAAGNHQRLIMNITIWLATENSATNLSEQYYLDNIKIYPNPTSGQLTISFEDNLSEKTIKILDITGRIIKTILIDQLKNSIDMKELNSGIYFLHIFSEDQLILSRKIIKVD